VYRVRTTVTGGSGGPYLSTSFFNVIGGLEAQDAVADLRAFWQAIRGNIWSGLTLTVEPDVAEIDIATGEVTGLVPTTSTPVTGDNSAEPTPWTTQGLIRWRSGIYVAGREIRGRTFIPGVNESVSQSGVPSSTYKSSIESAAATLLSSSVSEMVVYSRKHHELGPVLLGSVWSQWASLRSRRD